MVLNLWRKTRCSALQRRSSSLTTPSLLKINTRVGQPASKQIRIRVRLQAYRQRRTPAGPRPSGATATARSFTLPSHQSPAAHESWVCRRRVVFGWIDSGELKHCFYIAPVALQSAGDSARCFLQFALLGGGRKGRGRHIGSGRGLSCGRGRFRLRRGRRRRCTRFFRGGGRPRYVSIFGGRGLGGRGRPPHIGLFLRRRFFRGRGLGGRGRPPHMRFPGAAQRRILLLPSSLAHDHC